MHRPTLLHYSCEPLSLAQWLTTYLIILEIITAPLDLRWNWATDHSEMAKNQRLWSIVETVRSYSLILLCFYLASWVTDNATETEERDKAGSSCVMLLLVFFCACSGLSWVLRAIFVSLCSKNVLLEHNPHGSPHQSVLIWCVSPRVSLLNS